MHQNQVNDFGLFISGNFKYHHHISITVAIDRGYCCCRISITVATTSHLNNYTASQKKNRATSISNIQTILDNYFLVSSLFLRKKLWKCFKEDKFSKLSFLYARCARHKELWKCFKEDKFSKLSFLRN